MKHEIPKEVGAIAAMLEQGGFSAYLVGGCVRDILLKREPKDWDIATSATPEEIQKIFTESVYENTFGTVAVKTESEDPRLRIVEVTTFRKDGAYTDRRHPDSVSFAKAVEEDLSRRDFTVNALALDGSGVSVEDGSVSGGRGQRSRVPKGVVDPCGGQKDLKEGLIRAVGNPDDRFKEDALRLIRAVRFAAELGFEIEFETRRAIERHAGLLEAIAAERVRDELVKMLMAPGASRGVVLLEELDLLRHVLPDLREGLGVAQNLHHIYTVFEHNIRALDYAAKENCSLAVRLAALLHDVGKPRTKRGEGKHATFYGHEVVGAKMAVRALDRLRFPKDVVEQVVHLVRFHMFYYNVGEVSEAGVRRFLNRVGPECVDDLLKVREADRIGSGVPKAVPYKNRHLQFMIEKVKRDPISPKMLKVDGKDVMRAAHIEPSREVGEILGVLLEEVLDDSQKNELDYLEKRILELHALGEKERAKFASAARERKEEFESGLEEEIKGKYRVK